MAETHVISGLVSKRSELAGLLSHYQKEISRISKELSHIDHTIKIFNPDFDLRTIRARKAYQKSKYFKHGEANRLILDVMRLQNKPMTTNDITLGVINHKGLTGITSNNEKSIKASLLTILHRLEKANKIKRSDKEGINVLWELLPFELG